MSLQKVNTEETKLSNDQKSDTKNPLSAMANDLKGAEVTDGASRKKKPKSTSSKHSRLSSLRRLKQARKASKKGKVVQKESVQVKPKKVIRNSSNASKEPELQTSFTNPFAD